MRTHEAYSSSKPDPSTTPNSANDGQAEALDGASTASGVGTTEMIRLTGATYRMLDYWEREGILVAAVREARGSGYPSRVYAAWQIGRVKVLVALQTLLGRIPGDLSRLIAAEPERTYHAAYKEGPVTVLVKFGGSEDWGQDAD